MAMVTREIVLLGFNLSPQNQTEKSAAARERARERKEERARHNNKKKKKKKEKRDADKTRAAKSPVGPCWSKFLTLRHHLQS